MNKRLPTVTCNTSIKESERAVGNGNQCSERSHYGNGWSLAPCPKSRCNSICSPIKFCSLISSIHSTGDLDQLYSIDRVEKRGSLR